MAYPSAKSRIVFWWRHCRYVLRTAWMNTVTLAMARLTQRPADFVIGEPDDLYLMRWWLLPRNRVCNIYLHLFLRSDDDRALHDHPWINCSVILRGRYIEHTIAAGGIHHRREFRAGDIKLRGPRAAHRIELHDGPCWTLFLTGPNVRTWGFHCPESGWIPWQRFTAPGKSGEIGKGCEG